MSSQERDKRPGRHAQMSAQEDWIAQKRREIEEKMTQKRSNSGQNLDNLASNSKATPGHSAPKISRRNQWGFKGKAKQTTPKEPETEYEPQFDAAPRFVAASKEPAPQATATVSAPTGPKFSNDGSFLERFKKMQEEQNKIKSEYGNVPQATAAPQVVEPPVPQPQVVVPQVPPPQVHQPQVVKVEVKEEEKKGDAWYKSALERAKMIAQTLSKEGASNQVEDLKHDPNAPTPTETKEVKDEIKEESVNIKPEVSPLAPKPEESSSSSSVAPKLEPLPDLALPTVAEELASLVALNGDAVEILARERNLQEEALLFLQDHECDLYRVYRAKIDALRAGMSDEKQRVRKKSRWGSEDDKVVVPQQQNINILVPTLIGGQTRSPEVMQYAMKVFGSLDLEQGQWKQCEDQIKMSAVYQDIMLKQQKQAAMIAAGKIQYEYDSDEDTEGGTWEHKARALEMEKTRVKADELTEAAKGKHHIGDFLPPDELQKFLAKYDSVKNGSSFDESDYKDNKLTNDNVGFKMLQKMGWSEGAGLGSTGQGITNPINQGKQSGDKKGLGIVRPDDLEQDDDEFDAYRKRMMLAYRFRPNPMNNPRRTYY